MKISRMFKNSRVVFLFVTLAFFSCSNVFCESEEMEKIYPFEAAQIVYTFSIYVSKDGGSEKLADQGTVSRYIRDHGAGDALEITGGSMRGQKLLLYQNEVKKIDVPNRRCVVLPPDKVELAMVLRYVLQKGDDETLQQKLNYVKSKSEDVLGFQVNVYEGGFQEAKARVKITPAGIVLETVAIAQAKDNLIVTVEAVATRFEKGKNDMIGPKKFQVPPRIRCRRDRYF